MSKCKVGVLFGLTRQFHCTVSNAIRRIVGKKHDFSVACLNAELSTSELTEENIRERILASALSSDPYNVFVAVGQRAALAAKKVADEVGGQPIIFVGVRDPLVLNLIDSFDTPGNNVSAVVRDSQSDIAVAEKLAHISGYIKKLFFPIGHWVRQDI